MSSLSLRSYKYLNTEFNTSWKTEIRSATVVACGQERTDQTYDASNINCSSARKPKSCPGHRLQSRVHMLYRSSLDCSTGLHPPTGTCQSAVHVSVARICLEHHPPSAAAGHAPGGEEDDMMSDGAAPQ